MDELNFFKQIANPESDDPSSYWNTLKKISRLDPNHMTVLASYERALRELDSNSWKLIQPRAVQLSTKLDPFGRYREFFELLNEVKGYAYLKSLGCEGITFIPRSSKRNTKTPDLTGLKNGQPYFCEVKTKNTSVDYEQKVKGSHVIRTGKELPHQMLESISSTITKAYQQLSSYKATNSIAIIYLCISYDNEGVDTNLRYLYNSQIKRSFEELGLRDVILQIDDNSF